MKKTYLLILCFGIGFFALGIPFINKINVLAKIHVFDEKKDKKPDYETQKKKQTNAIKKKVKAQKAKMSAAAPLITNVQTVTVQGGGNATPDGQLNYSFVISNTGDPATGLTFTDQLIADLTYVPGSLKSTPVAADDSYQSIGNVGIIVPASSGVLANDNSPTGQPMTATVATAPANGTLNLASNGSFTYTPNAGYMGNDSFIYTVTTGTTSSTGVAIIQNAGMIWFVDPTVMISGTGTLQSPFKNMGDITGTGVGQTIFVYDGSPTGAVSLLNNQKLVGQGAASPLVGAGSISGISTVPTFSNPIPSTDGTNNPTITHTATALTLAMSNDIQGLNINTSGGPSITGASVGNLKVRNVNITSTAGQALQITAGGALDVQFISISAANAAKGISVNNATGNFQILGTGTTAGSGGTISTITTRGIELKSCANITLKNMNFVNANTVDGTTSSATDNTAANAGIFAQSVNGLVLDNIQMNTTLGNANAQHGISLNNVNNFSLANSTITRCGTTNDQEACIYAVNTTGTNSISNSTLSKASRITRWSNTNANMTLRITGSSFNDTRTLHDNTSLNAAGQSGILFQGIGNSQMSLDVKSLCNFLRIASQGVNVLSEGTAMVNADVQNSTFNSTNTALPAGEDVGLATVMEATGSSNLNFNIKNNTITGRGGSLIGLGTLPSSTAKLQGTVEGNTVNYNFVSAVSNNAGFGINYNHLGNNTDSRVKIINNTLTGFRADGTIGISSLIQAGKAHVICTNNNVSHLPVANMAAGYGIRISVTVAGAAGCARVASNNVTNNALSSGYAQLRASVAGTTFDIEGSGNIATPEVSIWNLNNNTPSIATNTSPTFISSGGSGTRTLVAANTCLAPTNGLVNLRVGVEEPIVDAIPEGIENKEMTERLENTVENNQLSSSNTDLGISKIVAVENKTNTSEQGQSGETITVNGSGSGFALPTGKSTTITFSATIAAAPTSCQITNVGSIISPAVTSNTTSNTLEIENPINPEISNMAVCSGGSSLLTASCATGTVKWYDQATAGNLLGTGPSVILNNLNNTTNVYVSCTVGSCEGVRQNLGGIAVFPNPDATITAPASICQQESINLSVTSAGLTSILWTGPGLTNAMVNPTTATAVALGNTIYNVTVTDANGCTATSSKTVNINPTPVVTLPTLPTLCFGQQSSITANCVMNVSAVLTGANEVPPVASAATGYVYGTYNTLTNMLDLTMVYNGLSGNISNGHIHIGAAGASGGPIVQFAGWPANSKSGSFTYSGTGLPATNKAAFLAGNTYVNIHSSAFPGGEIRGQLMPVCSADTYAWSTTETGQTISIWPAVTQNYTVTASNSLTGCTSLPVSTLVNVTPITLPTVATSVTKDAADLYYFTPTCENIAEVSPAGPVPVTGNVTAKVWVESTPPFTYVPRHYEITPATNPNGVSGNVTLYFSQADFDAYNATVVSSKLPANPMDAAGIANFQIAKFAGTSPTGLPGAGGYVGPPTMIPAPGQAWNTTMGYSMVYTNNVWKVTFPVNSFSGFIATSIAQPLPINLISFTGKNTEKGNLLLWKTASEQNFSHFEIERSSLLAPKEGITGQKFEIIGQQKPNEFGNYEFLDSTPPLGRSDVSAGGLYRLKMLDLDGSYKYSKIVSIINKTEKAIVGNFYPNPAKSQVNIEINATEAGNWVISTFDVTGKVIKTQTQYLQKGVNKVSINKLTQGANFVRFESGAVSEIRKLIAE